VDIKSPSVTGGAIYLRPLGLERAKFLASKIDLYIAKMEISIDKSYYEQQNERLNYISDIWELICHWIENSKISQIELAKLVNHKEGKRLGASLFKFGPSYKVAKIIKLKALQKGLL
jgi:hypothetical protein